MNRLNATPCPVCGGPIGLWAATATIKVTCHHCKWVLASNWDAAFWIGVAVGCVTETMISLVIYFVAGTFLAVVRHWGGGGSIFSMCVGALAYSLALKLRVVSPPLSGDTPEQPFVPTVPLNPKA